MHRFVSGEARSAWLVVASLAGALASAACASPSPPVRNFKDPPPPNASARAPAVAGPTVAPPEEPENETAEEAEPSRAWLGVELALRPPGEPGVLVRAVVPGSPAERAGILKGDVIATIDSQGVGRPADVVSLVGSHRAGDRIAIALTRGDQQRLFAAVLEPQPNDETLMRKRYVDAMAPSLTDLKPVRGSVNPNLKELRGNVVVVEFWASWCVPCRITAPLLSSWSNRYTPEGLRVLGITGDPVVQAADAAERHGMTYPVFSDENGSTTLAYRAFALPTLFVIDRRGVVRDVVVGFSTSRLKETEALIGRLLAER